MSNFIDDLGITGHLTIHKKKEGKETLLFDDKNVIVSGMGVGLSYLFSASGSNSIVDYQLAKFQVGVSGFSGNQVSSTFQLSGPLSSVAEYGADSDLFIQTTEQIKNGVFEAGNLFALIPHSKVTRINDTSVRYTMVLDEEACNDIDASRGNTALSEIGLFMKNPSRSSAPDAALLVAYRTFSSITKTSDFSLVFRWTINL